MADAQEGVGKSPDAPLGLGDLNTEEELPLREFGRYELKAVLGRGAAGVVYRAWDRELGRAVALKLLLGGALAGKQQVERFFREARAAARLDDPGIVRVLDIGRTPEGAVWFAMEMVEGTSLSAWIKEHGSMPVNSAVAMVRELARTLQRLHDAGIVHRDLKPSNVLLGPNGTVKLADFGIAGDMHDSEDRLTRTGQLLGTPAYMAPEVHMGVRPNVSWPLVDVYGLGMILLESLTGAALVPEGDVYVRGESAGEMVPMPRPLRLICEKATRERPEGRYATAGELRADLQRYLSAEAVLASPLSLQERGQLFWKRHRAMIRTVATTLAVLVACISLGYWLSARWNARQQQLREAEVEGRLNATRSRIDQLRAEGREAEAEELMDHFLQAPEHANHRAVTRAWLERAEAADAAGREAEATAAYGRAWAGVDPGISRKAFRGIVSYLRRAGRWRPLSAALDMIRRGEGGYTPAEQRAIEVELHLARGAFAAARDAARGGAEESLLQVLSGAQPLGDPPIGPGQIRSADLNRDGRDELFLDRRGSWEQWGADNQVRPIALSSEPPPDEPRILLWSFDGATRRLVEAQATGAWLREEQAAALPIAHWATVGKRLFTVINGYERRFLVQDDLETLPRTAHPGVEGLQSYITAMITADLDEDGIRELVVGVGPPEGFELRVFDASGPELVERARKKIGYVCGLAAPKMRTIDRGGVSPQPLLAVGICHQHPSAVIFPRDNHHGAAAGIHFLRYTGHSLEEEGRPLPAPVGMAHTGAGLGAFDLDQDGFDELFTTYASGENSYAAIYHARPGGDYWRSLIEGWQVMGGGQFDADGWGELILTRQESLKEGGGLWMIGSGGDQFPFQDIPAPILTPPELPAAWRPHMRLAMLGMPELAADELDAVAEMEEVEPMPAMAFRQAAALWTSAGRHQDAARSWENAARKAKDLVGIESLAFALDSWREALRPIEAYAVAQRLAQSGHVGAMDKARAVMPWLEVIGGAPSFSLNFNEPLSPEWLLLRPELVRRNAREGKLEVDAVRGAETLLRLPLERTAVAGSLTVELEVSRSEWGSRLNIELLPVGEGEGQRLEITGGGGGGFLFRRVNDAVSWELKEGPEQSELLLLELVHWPEGYWSFAVSVDGVERARRRIEGEAGAAGLWELRFRSAGEPGLTGALSRQKLVRLDLRGFIPTLRDLPPAPTAGEAELAQLRLRLDPGDPELRRGLSTEEYFSRLLEDYRQVGFMHPSDAELVRTLTHDLPDPGPYAATIPAARQILALRGQVHWQAGNAEAARRDLERVAALPGATPRDCFDLFATLAEIAVAEGREEEGIAHARAALGCGLVRELAQDRLARRPLLAPRQGTLPWREILPVP